MGKKLLFMVCMLLGACDDPGGQTIDSVADAGADINGGDEVDGLDFRETSPGRIEETLDTKTLRDHFDSPELEGTTASPYKIGSDNRQKVQDTTKWPYATVVKIYTYFWQEDLRKYVACTGTLIEGDTVLTAAHCLYNTTNAYGYPYSVRVVPGAYLDSNGKEKTPFGEVYGMRAQVPRAYQRKEYDETGRIPYDYGVLRLKSSVPNAKTRELGIMPSPMDQPATMLAYHSDVKGGGVMTESSDRVRKVFEEIGTFNHYIDCETKASGAAITGAGEWRNVIFGIHSASRMDLSGNKYNTGVLITEDVMDDITSWSDH